jgi:NAD(P)-dependent dehydrogenase (short-subunit alcohol dehydrogenase family)
MDPQPDYGEKTYRGSEGGSIINTASINGDSPSPHLPAYGTTKGAIQISPEALRILAKRGDQSECGGSGACVDAANPLDHAARGYRAILANRFQ